MKRHARFYAQGEGVEGKISTSLTGFIVSFTAGLMGLMGSWVTAERNSGAEGADVAARVEAEYGARADALANAETRLDKIGEAVSSLEKEMLLDEGNAALQAKYASAGLKLKTETAAHQESVKKLFEDIVLDRRIAETRADNVGDDAARKLDYSKVASEFVALGDQNKPFLKVDNAYLRECQTVGASAKEVVACAADLNWEKEKLGFAIGAGGGLGAFALLPYAAAFRRRRKEEAAAKPAAVAAPEPREQVVSTNIKVTYVPRKD